MQSEAPAAFEPVGVDEAEAAASCRTAPGEPPIVERPVVRIGEFDARVRSDVNSQALLEPSCTLRGGSGSVGA